MNASFYDTGASFEAFSGGTDAVLPDQNFEIETVTDIEDGDGEGEGSNAGLELAPPAGPDTLIVFLRGGYSRSSLDRRRPHQGALCCPNKRKWSEGPSNAQRLE